MGWKLDFPQLLDHHRPNHHSHADNSVVTLNMTHTSIDLFVVLKLNKIKQELFKLVNLSPALHKQHPIHLLLILENVYEQKQLH